VKLNTVIPAGRPAAEIIHSAAGPRHRYRRDDHGDKKLVRHRTFAKPARLFSVYGTGPGRDAARWEPHLRTSVRRCAESQLPYRAGGFEAVGWPKARATPTHFARYAANVQRHPGPGLGRAKPP